MAKITKAEASMIKAIMKEEAWDIVLRLKADKEADWNAAPIFGNTSFQTLRSLHVKQGKVEGIIEFFDELERKAFD